MHILRHADLIDTPWKNGKGITRDIASGVLPAQTAWRMSRADVTTDRAFSNFAGLTRILTIVTQGAMTLEHAGGALQVQPGQPVRFDGGLSVFARLTAGPLTDLNLMFDPKVCEGDVVPHRGPYQVYLTPPVAGVIAVHVLAGTPEIGDTICVVGDTAFPTETVPMMLSEGDAVLEITLRYLPQSDAIKLCIAAL